MDAVHEDVGAGLTGRGKQPLEPRLERFAITAVRLAESLPNTCAGRYYADQLLRAAGSAALNYAERQGGSTHRDFTNKLKLVFRELREARLAVRIIQGAGIHPGNTDLSDLLSEADELVAILAASVKKAEQRSPRRT